jgi:hypothetical protein
MLAIRGRVTRREQHAPRSYLRSGPLRSGPLGITNDLFPIARNEDDDCSLSYAPFDQPHVDTALYDNPLKIMPAWIRFTEFMRFVDAPRPAPQSASAKRGEQLFSDIGCALCHTPSFKTVGVQQPQTPSQEIGPHTAALRGQTVNLSSDLLVHRMDAVLADNIVQGDAGPDEFRTTPLWGRYLPYAFTEHGAIQAANVLNCPRAVEIGIYVVRAFVQLREFLSSNKDLAQRLDQLEARIEKKRATHDKAIAAMLSAIRQLMNPPAPKRRPIGFTANFDEKP